MLAEVKAWGLKPLIVTGDSWYASKENLNVLKDKEFGGLFALEANRSVSVERGGKYVQVQSLDIPTDGLIVYLKQVGQVKVFRTVFKNEFRYYTIANNGLFRTLSIFKLLSEQGFSDGLS